MIGLLLAAQLAIVAQGPDTATVCAPFEITVASRVPGLTAPRVALARSPVIQLLRSATTSRPERDALGQPSMFSETTLLVAASAVGRIAIPPIVVTAGTRRGTAPSVVVSVHDAASSAAQVLVRASIAGLRGRRSDSVYVGQQVDYVVDVQLNETARQRLRRNPTFFPPEMPAVLAYDLAPPGTIAREGRHCFETLSYHRALFPLFPGAAVIPPAALTYSLPLSTSFFSREESFELRTDSVRFVALEPPAAMRPADYAGAVGRLTAIARLAATQGRMGDPVTLTLRVAGTGNVKLLPRPALALDWASVAPTEERVEIDTTMAEVQGAKEFDWLVTPRRAGAQVVAPMRYPFFDPERGAYDVALTAGLTLDVAAAALASSDSLVPATLAIVRTLGPERAPPLASRPWFWALLVAAPVPAALRRIGRRRRLRASGLTPARRLHALAAAALPATPREVRRLYLDALAERVAGAGDTSARLSLARRLRRGGVTEPVARRAAELLERLDTAAFSVSSSYDPSLAESAVEVLSAVDREAVKAAPRRVPRGSGVVALLAAVALSSPALLALSEPAARAYEDGVRAYARSDFAAAERLFARAASHAPRAPDAWASYGTAAWAAKDTAAAARGWQRALRLDPLDDESRTRLAALQTPTISAPAYVPPLPVNALAWGGLLLWLVAWSALAIPIERRPAAARVMAGGTMAMSLLALAGALALRDRLDASSLGVLRVTRQLHESPASISPVVAGAAAGETGALGPREGLWIRLALDGSRAGWLPLSDVLPLEE